MLNGRVFLKYWLPPLLWMALIFTASGDPGSFKHSSRIIGPLLHWLFPQMPEETVVHIVVVARKCAHLTEYAILALLFWRALRQPVQDDPRPWSWPLAGWAALGVLVYAVSDEFHQLFVPGRGASGWDVVLDTTGGVIGLLVFRAWREWRLKKRIRPTLT